MNNWMVTSQLRFVERTVKGKWIGDYYGEPMYESRVVRILQQKWLKPMYAEDGYKCDYEYEWRDVPVVDEE